jgi:hypothetical protein
MHLGIDRTFIRKKRIYFLVGASREYILIFTKLIKKKRAGQYHAVRVVKSLIIFTKHFPRGGIIPGPAMHSRFEAVLPPKPGSRQSN